MRKGIISDVHGNIPALNAVLTELKNENVDEIYFLGDCIGLLGNPKTSLEMLRENVDEFLIGNHDTRIFKNRRFIPLTEEEATEVQIAMDTLTEKEIEWLASRDACIQNENVVYSHSQPSKNKKMELGLTKDDAGILPKDVPSFESDIDILNNKDDMVVVGHNHQQFAQDRNKFDGKYGAIISVGSVGYPYNHNNSYNTGRVTGKASYSIIHPDEFDWELKSVEYNSKPVFDFLESIGLGH